MSILTKITEMLRVCGIMSWSFAWLHWLPVGNRIAWLTSMLYEKVLRRGLRGSNQLSITSTELWTLKITMIFTFVGNCAQPHYNSH